MESYDVATNGLELNLYSNGKEFFTVIFDDDDILLIKQFLTGKEIKNKGNGEYFAYDKDEYFMFHYGDGSGRCLINDNFIVFLASDSNDFKLKFKLNKYMRTCLKEICRN